MTRIKDENAVLRARALPRIADGHVALDNLIFHPKIDFVTLDGVSRPGPEGLSGSCKWPRRYHGRRLTLHDPSPADLAALQTAFPYATLVEMEVAIDVRPQHDLDEAEHTKVLDAVKAEFFARRLKPSVPAGLASNFRGTYIPRPGRSVLNPFNHRVPKSNEQHLHGTRHDAVQVKVYFKKRDNGKPLNWKNHVIRIEVRLGQAGLNHHRLEVVGDLFGFAFRKELTPYFRLVRGTVRASARAPKSTRGLLRVLNMAAQKYDDEHWKAVGVGAFLRGGKRQMSSVRFLRDQRLNERIGQALHRLQLKHARKKFVWNWEPSSTEKPVCMRAAA